MRSFRQGCRSVHRKRPCPDYESALAQLPPGALKSATFAGGSWTLDLARLDAAAAARVDRDIAGAGLAVIAAPSASGMRMRLSPAAGTELP